VYNIILGDLVTEHSDWIENYSIVRIKTYMRDNYIVDKTLKNKKWLYLNRTPSVIRRGAIDSLMADISRYRTVRDKFLKNKDLYPNARKFKGKPQKFHVRFKSHLYEKDSICIEATSFKCQDEKINDIGNYESFSLYGRKEKSMNHIKVSPHCNLTKETVCRDFKIHYCYGNYYLIAPGSLEVPQKFEFVKPEVKEIYEQRRGIKGRWDNARSKNNFHTLRWLEEGGDSVEYVCTSQRGGSA